MVRYKKSIKSGVYRVPQEIKEAFGDEIVIAPNLRAAAMYSPKTSKKAVIKSLELIIQDIKNEMEFEEEEREEKQKSESQSM